MVVRIPKERRRRVHESTRFIVEFVGDGRRSEDFGDVPGSGTADLTRLPEG